MPRQHQEIHNAPSTSAGTKDSTPIDNTSTKVANTLRILKRIGHPQLWPAGCNKRPELRYTHAKNLKAVRAYLTSLVKSFEGETTWIDRLSENSLCDNFLLEAGLATVRYPENVIVLSTKVSLSVHFILQRAGSMKKLLSQATERVTAEIDSLWEKKWLSPKVLIPWLHNDHWGMVFAIVDDKTSEHGTVFWGDSLKMGAPPRVLNIIKLAMETVTKEPQYDPFYTIWRIQDGNGNTKNDYMLDQLRFTPQTDGYSCGFYCIRAAWRFGLSNPYLSSSYLKGSPSGVISSEIRRVVVRTVLSAILQCEDEKLPDTVRDSTSSVSHAEVSRLISNIRARKVSHRTTIQRVTSSTWPMSRVNGIQDIHQWMTNLNKEGFFTGAIVQTPVKNDYRYDWRLRTYCICRQRVQRCKASISFSRNKDTAEWEIELKGIHNHGRLPQCAKSKRHTLALKDLASSSESKKTFPDTHPSTSASTSVQVFPRPSFLKAP